jgi:hypothetical protein
MGEHRRATRRRTFIGGKISWFSLGASIEIPELSCLGPRRRQSRLARSPLQTQGMRILAAQAGNINHDVAVKVIQRVFR